jgi:predicted dinucleotide-utilizing enzyme
MTRTRIGILGFGTLGQYLCERVLTHRDTMELAFVWSRSPERFSEASLAVPEPLRLSGPDLEAALAAWSEAYEPAELIAEVCHPAVLANHAVQILRYADLMAGSPTAFASAAVESDVREILRDPAQTHGCYLASGALWGVDDILKLKRLGALRQVSVTMKKHPNSFKLGEPLHSGVQAYADDDQQTEPYTIYDGAVRELCPLAPNNVNTMACAAMAGLGFDETRACLIADKSLTAHIVDIRVEDRYGLLVRTERYNPAAAGAVTGDATYDSFWSSLKRAGGQGPGLFFC